MKPNMNQKNVVSIVSIELLRLVAGAFLTTILVGCATSEPTKGVNRTHCQPDNRKRVSREYEA